MILAVFVISLSVFVITTYLLFALQENSLEDIYRIAKTGDIIYFRWEHMSVEMNYITPFTHVGMVLVDPSDSKKYILETHSAKDLEYLGIITSGINIYPLRMRLATYKGKLYYSRLHTHVNMDIIRFVEFMAKIVVYKDTIPFLEGYKAYYMRDCIISPTTKRTALYCSEFLGLCLKDLGILSKDFNHLCLLPHAFMHIVDDNGNKLYGRITQIRI